MNLRSITLRNWKAYRHARFELPNPVGNRNIILIGAPNGFGKTSLFEALTLGLFGREGLRLVPRATVGRDGEASAKLSMSYSNFLRDALHRSAIRHGQQSCSVEVEFDDIDGDEFALQRQWHYSSSGQHKQADDELVLFEGKARRPVGPPATIGDRDAWYRDYITQSLLPPDLAQFFLFDGEQVQRFARRDMSSQVKEGIKGLLGLPVLQSLAESLDRYATARRTSVAAPSDDKVQSVQADIARLEREIKETRKKLADIDALLPSLEQERDDISSSLGAFGGGTVALVADLLKQEEAQRNLAQQCIDKLMDRLSTNVSMALAGAGLRSAAMEQLRSESIREQWESGRNQGNTNLERYLGNIEQRLTKVQPPLSTAQRSSVVVEAKEAWDSLWHPAPKGCATEYLEVAPQFRTVR